MSLTSLRLRRRLRRRHRLTPPSPPAATPRWPCTDLQSAINAMTGGPITFGNDGVSLTPADQQFLTQVADKLKACPNAHVTINGYTDNSGTDASTSR